MPVEKASRGLLGVINGRDEFEFTYRVRLPQITAPAAMWLPLARSDRFQTVQVERIQAPVAVAGTGGSGARQPGALPGRQPGGKRPDRRDHLSRAAP